VDVVILDATMPGKDPIEAMRELASSYPEVKTIVYSGYNQPEFVDRVIDAGAWGSVSKHDNPDCVIRAISEIVRGRVVFPGRGR
ncbi:MAG: response regulator, partial [Phycisphaerales bacterium]